MSAELEGLTWSPLPWQLTAWQQLEHWLSSDRLPHAVLLSGPAGVGKQRFAEQSARRLLCAEPQKQEDSGVVVSCGHCRQCQLVDAGSHPDLKIVEPEAGGRQIRIDQIRRLADQLAQTAQMGSYRITVIHPAEAMNANAANALLKTLEEPGQGNLLLLVSHFPGMLPATIRSRCQGLVFSAPTAAVCRSWLSVRGIEPSMAERALEAAEMRPMRAWSLLREEGEVLATRLQRAAQWRQLIAGELDPVALAESWQGESLVELVVWLRGQLAKWLLDPWRGGDTSGTDGSLTRQLMVLDDQLVVLQRQLLGGASPNPQLTLEAIFLRTCDIVATKGLGQRWR